jgi:hypothetical protein
MQQFRGELKGRSLLQMAIQEQIASTVTAVGYIISAIRSHQGNGRKKRAVLAPVNRLHGNDIRLPAA